MIYVILPIYGTAAYYSAVKQSLDIFTGYLLVAFPLEVQFYVFLSSLTCLLIVNSSIPFL